MSDLVATQNVNTLPELWFDRLELAEDPSATPELLNSLGLDEGALGVGEDEIVRGAVAKHSSTLPETLSAMAYDPSDYVLHCLAQNVNSPSSLLVMITSGGYFASEEAWKTLAAVDPEACVAHRNLCNQVDSDVIANRPGWV